MNTLNLNGLIVEQSPSEISVSVEVPNVNTPAAGPLRYHFFTIDREDFEAIIKFVNGGPKNDK